MTDTPTHSQLQEGKWPRWTKRVREVQNTALEQYVAEVVEEAHTDFHSAFGIASQHCGSPIEALFLAAFLGACLGDPSYRIHPQHRVGSYRADFYITFMGNGVIVECDGHDYHERTKEQAEHDKKRDRAITSAGIPVFRFTGRELHRDPSACVEEVVDYLQRRRDGGR